MVAAYEPIARARPSELEPELVLRFGEMPTCKPLRQWLAAIPGCGAARRSTRSHGWNEPSRIAGAIVRAHPEPLCEGLVERFAGRRPDHGWADSWLAAAGAAGEAIAAGLDRADNPTEPGLQRALGDAYADGELVYTASSMPIRDQEAFLPSGEADVVFLANRGANGIDGLVSSGIGAAHASGRPTVIVTGELGLLHDIGGLAALRDVDTPVRIVVVNNGGGAIFDFLPQAEQLDAEEFDALLGTPRAVDCERAAELFGLAHRRVSDLSELQAALVRGTGLIEVRVDRGENVAVHRRLTEAAVAAVRDAI